jgi:hypothetical protein
LSGLPLAVDVADVLLKKRWVLELLPGSERQPWLNTEVTARQGPQTLGAIVEACLATMVSEPMTLKEDDRSADEVAAAAARCTSSVAMNAAKLAERSKAGCCVGL